jgi:hypothetical protein
LRGSRTRDEAIQNRAPAIVQLMENFTGTSKEDIERTIPYVDPKDGIDASSIDTQIAWYKSRSLIKSDIKAADIIDTRYAILIPTP